MGRNKKTTSKSKNKQGILWSQLKPKYNNDVIPKVNDLKKHNEELDTAMCELYNCFQTKSSIKYYQHMATFIDNNAKWIKNYNDLQININTSYETAATTANF